MGQQKYGGIFLELTVSPFVRRGRVVVCFLFLLFLLFLPGNIGRVDSQSVVPAQEARPAGNSAPSLGTSSLFAGHETFYLGRRLNLVSELFPAAETQTVLNVNSPVGIGAYQKYLTGANLSVPQGCAGACLNPHPGPYQWWWGPPNGCWTPQWRRWPEGCTHYQMFNTCANYWDPEIHWTCCVH